MSVEWIRKCCMSFPHATEQVQWENDLLFKVGGKMFAATPLIPAPVFLSFKCTPEDFAALTERPGVIPAPYLARAQWMAMESEGALPAAEVKRLLRQSYDLVFAKLPKKMQKELGGMSARKAARLGPKLSHPGFPAPSSAPGRLAASLAAADPAPWRQARRSRRSRSAAQARQPRSRA